VQLYEYDICGSVSKDIIFLYVHLLHSIVVIDKVDVINT